MPEPVNPARILIFLPPGAGFTRDKGTMWSDSIKSILDSFLDAYKGVECFDNENNISFSQYFFNRRVEFVVEVSLKISAGFLTR